MHFITLVVTPSSPIFRRYALIQVSWYRMGIIGTDYKKETCVWYIDWWSCAGPMASMVFMILLVVVK